MQDHQETQLQVDPLLQNLIRLQFSQLRMVKMEPQLYIQKQDTRQLTLVNAMERLQLYIETRSRTQAHLDSVESAPAQPWFIDNAEDERWLVRFMARFSGLKAFGSSNLILSNKEVWDSMGHLWSDLRVLSLVLFKYATGQPLQRHLELAALLDRCPPRLESLQLSFSEQDMSFHPSSHEFTRVNNDVAAAGPGSVDLKDILTLRQAYIEGHLGGTAALQDVEIWIQFLCRCPNLQSLALGSCSSQIILRVAAKVKDHWPRLQEFATNPDPDRLAAIDTDMDESIAILLNATCGDPDNVDELDQVDNGDVDDKAPTEAADVHTPQQHRKGLKKVRFDRFIFSHHPYSLQSLLRMSDTLTHLFIRDCNFSDGFLNEPVLRLLRSCDRLEEVDLLPSGSHYRTKMMACSAQQFVNFISLKTSSSPWSSAQTLKVLRVAIEMTDQTSSADLYSSFSSSSTSIQSSVGDLFELQQEVCQILGSFAALQELSLGVYCEKDQTCSFLPRLFQQGDCLELMLESGLDLMSGLDQLRVLNVSRMAHHIGLEEAKWMRAHWPRLHTVLGLLRVKSLEYLPVDVPWWVSPERKARKDGSEESERQVLDWIGEHISWLQFT
ncbi:MAG: hypothetical protein JOS17DRAFT_372965 [Linnemannia elongata]|nr:MAG: hypothetical protein JOS17DRAFT_372965 [Linnemannia elongata]